MLKQLRGPERLFHLGQWAVALLFAYFLIQVGGSIIEDLPQVQKEIHLEDFQNRSEIAAIEDRLTPQTKAVDQLSKEHAALTEKIEQTQGQYNKAKESFENWRSTRVTTEQMDDNPQVVRRTQELDVLLKMQADLSSQAFELERKMASTQEAMQPLQEQLRKANRSAEEAYDLARKKEDLKAFFIRLLFVLPVLLLALWLFKNQRKGKHWPFVWGFVFFALFAFFFELVPYLPSFGGYIRYGVGAVLTFFGGRALINALQAYLAKKALEQAAPQEERKQDIRYEKALESLAREHCPSCERGLPKVEGALVNFCMHCGLTLFQSCPQCGLRHNAFFPFCPACGVQVAPKGLNSDLAVAGANKEAVP